MKSKGSNSSFQRGDHNVRQDPPPSPKLPPNITIKQIGQNTKQQQKKNKKKKKNPQSAARRATRNKLLQNHRLGTVKYCLQYTIKEQSGQQLNKLVSEEEIETHENKSEIEGDSSNAKIPTGLNMQREARKALQRMTDTRITALETTSCEKTN